MNHKRYKSQICPRPALQIKCRGHGQHLGMGGPGIAVPPGYGLLFSLLKKKITRDINQCFVTFFVSLLPFSNISVLRKKFSLKFIWCFVSFFLNLALTFHHLSSSSNVALNILTFSPQWCFHQCHIKLSPFYLYIFFYFYFLVMLKFW